MNRKITVASILAALCTMSAMLFTFYYSEHYGESTDDRWFFLGLAPFASVVASLVTLTLFSRVKPKKYIYLSYTRRDTHIAQAIATALEKNFSSLSKYRFEILIGDSAPYGIDMISGIKELVGKSDIVLVIVSHSYLESQWCLTEFKSFFEPSARKKLIIPVVINSFDDLSKLPVDLSNIKAVSLICCDTEEKVSDKMQDLAKDLIRRRTD